MCFRREAVAAAALGTFALHASSQGSVAHLFLELLEGACDLNIGLYRGSPVLSSESEWVSDSFKTLIFCPGPPLSLLLC